MLALTALAVIVYCMVGQYSPRLIRHVVEQSLVQKAPSGIDAAAARQRLETILNAEPGDDARVQRLLEISEYLERIQRMTHEEWDGPDESFLIRK